MTIELQNHVEPEAGDLLCVRYGANEWGFSGDRFSSRQGDAITAVQRFSGGQVRQTTRDKSEFRVLKGTQLFRIV